MKKQELKHYLRLAHMEQALLIDRVNGFKAELDDTKEALERRRALYDRLANHSTTQKPKSMNEMAEALYDMYGPVGLGMVSFKNLPQDEQDKWMDGLLTILN